MSTRVTAAAERTLNDRQCEATEEGERILAAAVRVMERGATEPPRVSDIVAEAGSSEKGVLLAVMERGVAIVVSDAAAALRHVADRKAIGKVVIDVTA